jgi:hypothetical protein
MATVRDLILTLVDEGEPDWAELRARSEAELSEAVAQSKADLEQFGFTGGAADLSGLLREAIHAVTRISRDDILRHAQKILDDSQERELNEVFAAFAAILLLGRPAVQVSGGQVATGDLVSPSADLRLSAMLAFPGWFSNPAVLVQAHLLIAWLGFLVEIAAALDAYGVASVPDWLSLHLGLVLAVGGVVGAHVSQRQHG